MNTEVIVFGTMLLVVAAFFLGRKSVKRGPFLAKDLKDDHLYKVISAKPDWTIGTSFNDVRPHLTVLVDHHDGKAYLFRIATGDHLPLQAGEQLRGAQLKERLYCFPANQAHV